MDIAIIILVVVLLISFRKSIGLMADEAEETLKTELLETKLDNITTANELYNSFNEENNENILTVDEIYKRLRKLNKQK